MLKKGISKNLAFLCVFITTTLYASCDYICERKNINRISFATLDIGMEQIWTVENQQIIGSVPVSLFSRTQVKKRFPSFGASVGIDFLAPLGEKIGLPSMRNLDIGIRLKYAHIGNFFTFNTHLVGVSFYLHPIFSNYYGWSSVPISLTMGGGGIISENVAFNGSYMEGGLSFFKSAPISANLLYRANFYDNGELSHSIHLILNFALFIGSIL